MIPTPIFDLHCDLLSYLEMPNTDAEDADRVGCALPHLRAGGVRLQVMAAFTLTGPESTASLQRQVELYQHLRKFYPVELRHVATEADLDYVVAGKAMGMAFAIENASGLCGEEEEISLAFARLDQLIAQGIKPLYITITHHAENRFGGGNVTEIGLKPDGEAILRFLDGKNIAVDFSHTSNELAADILHFMDDNGLNIPVLASHSNFRAIREHKRNLTDPLAQQIAQRGGIVGINFVRDFIHPELPQYLHHQIRHGWQATQHKLAFGADFFPVETLKDLIPPELFPIFHPEHQDASVYPQILAEVSEYLSSTELEDFAWKNAERWIRERLRK